MKTKQEIVKNWLTRYTGRELEDFGEYIDFTLKDTFFGNSALHIACL